MTISRYRLNLYVLPLRQSWRAGSVGFTQRQGWLLELQQKDGTFGYGDCAPLPSHATESLEIAGPALNATLTQFTDMTPEQALQQLSTLDPYPAARCAVETALLDLITKNRQQAMYRYLNRDACGIARVNANIGSLDEGVMYRATLATDQGYRVLKIKVGVYSPETEIEGLQKLCGVLKADTRVRLDANRSWDLPTAENWLQQIEGLPIESLEEPLTTPDLDALKQLQEKTSITLALDETAKEFDAATLKRLSPLRRIILKPMVHGGILPALELGQEAMELGIEVVVTTTVDSAAGVWAATQLAAALDSEAKLHHGLATGEWLTQDLGTCPIIDNSQIKLPDSPGLGFSPST